ncbi:ABC-type multidrug transport system, ATPase and permease component [Marinitoga piezophila KA3]|uniref:ABC-type multidrug transport system, ATPase and permease component n=1 Tax=Marinitoga piezophila (strain DSM 14283 / JCM 11233 / KA3) TaxID=443254 RepID=H2J6E7_MARPK|nr:ABC-type multidrug transport system, ATPase and permease component [Marinitoga piezophila KA3]
MNIIIKEFVKKNWWRYLIGIIFLLMIDYFQIFIPKKIGGIIDNLKNIENMNVIKTYIISMLTLAVSIMIGRFIWRFFIFGTSRLFEFKTANKMFGHILDQSYDFYDKWRTGDLMTRFTEDLNSVRMAMGPSIVMMIDTLFMSSITIYAMINFVNLKLTIYSLLPLPIIGLITLFFGKTIRKLFKHLQKTISDLSDHTEESYAGIHVVKVFSLEKTMLKRFNDRSQKYYDAQMSLIKTWGLMFPLIQFLASMSGVIAIYLGGKMVINEEITFGQLIMFYSYIGMLVWPMMAIGWVVNVLQRGKASYQRLMEIMKSKSNVPEPEKIDENYKFKGKIEIKNLNFKYPGTDKIVLKNINMNIEPGEMVAFVGKIGSGKSTIAKLLLKFYPVEDGKIFIDGIDINKLHSKVIRDNIAYVPQESFLFSMPIEDNISFAHPEQVEKAPEFAKIANVHEDILELPEKYKTLVGERGVTLSGGQKQRVSIARALAKDASFIILDDCLSAVDTETEEAIINNLRNNVINKTMIVISHRLKAVRNADKIFVFDDGEIIESGTHQELMALEGVYYGMYMKQLIEEKLEEE